MTTMRVEGTGDDAVVRNMPSAGDVSSSTDYDAKGVTVRNGMSSRNVSAADQIGDDDLITVQGMEVTGKMARELGLLGTVFDESLSAGAAAQAAAAKAEAPKAKESSGHEGYDQTTAALNAAIEAEVMTVEEATEYHTAVGEIAMADLTVTEVLDTINARDAGTLDPSEISQEHRAVIENAERVVTETATQSAKRELGPQGFNRLAEIARSNAEFNEVLRGFAVHRALGKADHTWAEFLAEAEEFVRGSR